MGGVRQSSVWLGEAVVRGELQDGPKERWKPRLARSLFTCESGFRCGVLQIYIDDKRASINLKACVP